MTTLFWPDQAMVVSVPPRVTMCQIVWRIRVGRRITHRPPPRQTTMITLTSATYADAAPAVQA